jgi:biotin/methionine sulfoxide reductase
MQIDSGGAAMHEAQQWMERIVRSKVEFINISPARDNTPDLLKADWLPIVPNTDTAMMLGLAHVLVSEDLHDKRFLALYCEGFKPFRRYLMGEADGVPKDAAWASRICGVGADTIRGLARRMAAKNADHHGLGGAAGGSW